MPNLATTPFLPEDQWPDELFEAYHNDVLIHHHVRAGASMELTIIRLYQRHKEVMQRLLDLERDRKTLNWTPKP